MFNFQSSLSHKSLLLSLLCFGSVYQTLIAQNSSVLSLQDTTKRPIITAVPFLNIALDSRATGMGDVGVATSPDANAVFWNAAKLAFAEEKVSASLTYNPWLRGLVGDMFLTSLSGYIKRKDREAFGAEIRYFNLGSVDFRDKDGVKILDFTPREYAIALSYARKLSPRFSMAVTGRFINSNLTGDVYQSGTGQDAKPGRSGSADVGFFYTIPELKLGKNTGSLNIGANISNIGGKISYINSGTADFLPGNMRLGAALTMHLDPKQMNQITFALDANKLLVPTVNPSQGLISGITSSFGDAPDGFSEEVEEIIVCGGVEYTYNKMFSARAGYFNESKRKGNRKYFTVGAGFRTKQIGFDVSYLIPQATRNNALDGTIRFTLIGYFSTEKKTVKIEGD